MEPLSPYLELRRQIDELVEKLAELRKLENELIRQILSDSEQPEIPLQFDDKTKIVRWLDRSLKLGGKSYRFLKTLWSAPRHQKKIESLEQSVWKSRGQKKSRQITVKTAKGIRKVHVSSRFLSQNTLKLFLFRLQNRLRTAQFPYRITPRKNRISAEIVGYGLKCTKIYKKTQKKIP